MQTLPSSDDAPHVRGKARVLAVDDSRMQLRLMKQMLVRMGYDVLTADSGSEALELCHAYEPEIILSDWMMPGMNGLEFCTKFRQLRIEQYGYFILLTSKSDKDDIARGFEAGADDFLTKPVNSAELGARLNAGRRVLDMQRQLQEQFHEKSAALAELSRIHDALEADLKNARNIQQALVPERSKIVQSSRVGLLLKPCGHVGGDLVGTFTTPSERIGFYSIDVSGHGITSAMVTARVAGYLSSVFLDQNVALRRDSHGQYEMREPSETAERLNERLVADRGVEEYLTMAFVSGDPSSGEMTLVQAGHPPPLLLRRDGTAEWLGKGGLPIGLIDGATYDQCGFSMQSGDRLLLYSDGFTEAVMKNGEMLNEAGLLDLFRQSSASAEGEELLQDLFWHLAQGMPEGADLADDVSAVLVEFDVLARP